MAKKAISVRLEVDLLERIDAAAKAAGSDRTAFLERAAEGLLDDATRAPVDLLPAMESLPRVHEAMRRVPGVRTAAEVRADPARAAGLARMARVYGKS